MTIFFLKRSLIDRRFCENMRKVYSLDYFENSGIEKRKYIERRKPGERRSDWIRVSKWCSVYVGTRYSELLIRTQIKKSENGMRNV